MKKNPVREQRSIPFGKLAREALPEIWTFQFWAAVVLAIPAGILTSLINSVAESGGTALTSANMRQFLLSWRAPVLLALGILLIICYIVVEVFAQIHMNGDILQGERTRVWREVGKGLRSVLRFLNPTGILVLLYIFIAVPLCGIGFSISLTETFYIPNFIMDTVRATPFYALLYGLVILGLIWVGWRSIFTVHGVLLDVKTPAEARRASVEIIRKNGRKFAWGLLKVILVVLLIQIAAALLFRGLPGFLLEKRGEELPRGHFIDVFQLTDAAPTKTDASVAGYRILCSLAVLLGAYLNSVVSLLCGAYLMLRVTRYYLAFSRGEPELWPERPKKSRYYWKVLGMIGVTVLVLLGSVMIGLFYNQIIDRPEPVQIIAHRAGGTMASENSLEGLYLAIEHGCHGSEIDVQRTRDGYYVINHDSTFQRVAGVNKSPQEMTLSEIRELRIKDTTGSGKELPVVTLEEMLTVIHGKEKLYIELKGSTADHRMVDDLVQMIRDADCVDECVFISLNYDVIDYAETNYPEFETGTLFFIGLGDVSHLNCDLLIMEESTATRNRIRQIHDAGKQAIVWTVNSEEGMQHFLDSEIDAVITDEIPLAQRVQIDRKSVV